MLSQPNRVGGVERVFSIFGWIQSKLRNNLLPATSDGAHVAEAQDDGGVGRKWEADLLQLTMEEYYFLFDVGVLTMHNLIPC